MNMNDPKWQSYFLWMQARGITAPKLVEVIKTTAKPEKLHLVFVSDLEMKERESALVARMASALSLRDDDWQVIPAIIDSHCVENGVPSAETLDSLQTDLWTRLPDASVYVIFGPLATRVMVGKGSFRNMQGTQMTKNDMTILPTYHPRDVLRQVDLKRDVWNDLQSAAKNWQN